MNPDLWPDDYPGPCPQDEQGYELWLIHKWNIFHDAQDDFENFQEIDTWNTSPQASAT